MLTRKQQRRPSLQGVNLAEQICQATPEKVRETYKAYHQHTSENNSEAHKKAKKHLEEAYNAAIEEDLSSKLHEVEIVYVKSQHVGGLLMTLQVERLAKRVKWRETHKKNE